MLPLLSLLIKPFKPIPISISCFLKNFNAMSCGSLPKAPLAASYNAAIPSSFLFACDAANSKPNSPAPAETAATSPSKPLAILLKKFCAK